MKPSEISVKTERYIELNIKREFKSNESAGSVATSEIAEKSWIEEKQILINKIVSLKTETQSNTLNLKSTKDQLEKVNHELKTKNEIHSKQVNYLEKELSAFEKMKSENEKRIPEFTKKKKIDTGSFQPATKCNFSA